MKRGIPVETRLVAKRIFREARDTFVMDFEEMERVSWNKSEEGREESRYPFSFWFGRGEQESFWSNERKIRNHIFSQQRSPRFSLIYRILFSLRPISSRNFQKFFSKIFGERGQSPCGKNVERFVRDRREHVFRSVTNSTGYRRPTLPRTTTLLSTR